MPIGPYAAAPESLPTLALMVAGAWRIRFFGVPRVPGESAIEIAKNVLRANARVVLKAGSGHFWPMWPSDFAKTLKGAEHALPPAYVRGLLDRMLSESARLGRVPSCFSSLRGFDMPWTRGDSLPWLVIALAEYGRWTGDRTLAAGHQEGLRALLDKFEQGSLEGGLVSTGVIGDWMDTVLRPSSTYNNLCALRMLQLAPDLGLRCRTDPADMEDAILRDRWRGDHFTDYAGAERWSVDAGALALYLDLFSQDLRSAVIDRIEASGLAEPYPLRSSPEPYPTRLISPLARLAPDYHSTIWLHLGAMYLNGLKKAGRDVSARQASLEELILRYGNCLETLDLDGRPWWTPVMACEPGLSMAAGQYLELALG